MTAPDLRHGTGYAYGKHKCRCDACRTYQNTRVAANRAARLARVGELTHGIRSTYDAGCRCTKCQGVRRKAYEREMPYLPRTTTQEPTP